MIEFYLSGYVSNLGDDDERCNIVTSDHTINELPVVVEHALRSLYIS